MSKYIRLNAFFFGVNTALAVSLGTWGNAFIAGWCLGLVFWGLHTAYIGGKYE